MSTSPAYDIYFGVDDTSPAIQRTLTDADGTAVDLSGATVTFIIEEVDGTDVVTETCSFETDGTDGVVNFTPSGIATAGTYRGKYKVVYSSGSDEHFPNDEWLSVRVTPVPATD